MTFENDDTRARRYLLGQTSDDESSALESEYFADEGALDRVAGAEDALIDDYLAGVLSSEDRERFERHYLASPEHRERVEAVGRLSGAVARRWNVSPVFLATAAALLLAVAGAVWTFPERQPRAAAAPDPPADATTASQGAQGNGAAAPTPRIFAVSLPAIAMRGDSTGAPVVVSRDVDVLRLELQSGASPAAVVSARARLETVAGAEVWSGPLSVTRSSNGISAAGHVDVPLDTLVTDDYIVVWLDTDAAGATRERGRYVLRLRRRT